MNNIEQLNYKDLLREHFAQRSERNPNYSLRAFARDLDISPSRISEILNNKKGLSGQNAKKIAKKLNLSKKESEIFLSLVQMECARSSVGKTKAKAALEKQIKSLPFKDLQMDLYKVISGWQHFAILELTHLKGFKGTPEWISKRLNISKIEAEMAISRLYELNMIERTKTGFKSMQDFSLSPDGIPSDAIKKSHDEILDKAKKAIYLQGVNERDFTSMTMAIDEARMDEAKVLIRKFREEFTVLMDKAESKNRVYCLSVQFFGLDEK